MQGGAGGENCYTQLEVRRLRLKYNISFEIKVLWEKLILFYSRLDDLLRLLQPKTSSYVIF